MTTKWHKSRTIQAALISVMGLGLISLLPTVFRYYSTRPKLPPAANDSGNILDDYASSEKQYKAHLSMLEPLSPRIFPSVSYAQAGEKIASLRKESNLRSLLPIETGKDIMHSPAGSYFYIWAAEILPAYKYTFVHSRISSQKELGYHFEVHSLYDNSRLLLAYVTDEVATSISYLDGRQAHDLTATPLPWSNHANLVLLPMDRLVTAEARLIQDKEGALWVLDMKIL